MFVFVFVFVYGFDGVVDCGCVLIVCVCVRYYVLCVRLIVFVSDLLVVMYCVCVCGVDEIVKLFFYYFVKRKSIWSF